MSTNETAEVSQVTVKTTRQKISKLIGINLSVSRVRKYIDKGNINKDVEQACSELKKIVSDAKKSEVDGVAFVAPVLSELTTGLVSKAYSLVYDDKRLKYDALKLKLEASSDEADKERLKLLEPFPVQSKLPEEQLELLSKLRCRFSNDASVLLASGIDYVIQHLVRSAMVNVKNAHKAIIQIRHIVDDNLAESSIYPLIGKLRVVQDYIKQCKVVNVADAVESVEVVEAVDAVEDDSVDSVEEHAENSTFEFYINLICKHVKATLVAEDESYSSIRISKHIRKFCSTIVIQLIERLAPLIKLYISNTKVKTINDGTIRFIINFIMTDDGVDSTELISFMDEKLALYHQSTPVSSK
jgi:hypothetical protein